MPTKLDSNCRHDEGEEATVPSDRQGRGEEETYGPLQDHHRDQREGDCDKDNGGVDGISPDEEEAILFSCRCESARSVATLLSCLRSVSSTNYSASFGGSLSSGADALSQRRGRSDLNLSAVVDTSSGGGASRRGGGVRSQHATVFASPTALTFHVHGLARQSQASVEMQAGLFSDYYVSEQTVPIFDENEDRTPTSQESRSGSKTVIQGGEFSINLTTVLECLHCLGTASLDRTKLCMSYDRQDAIFKIELLEDSTGGANPQLGGGILSTCAIPGLAVSDDEGEEGGVSSLAEAFRSNSIVARAILKSDYLRDAIIEIADVPGATSVTVAASPDGLAFAALGDSSECNVSLPHAGNSDVFVSLECNPREPHARNYPLHSVLSAMRGLEIGCETCISINARGMIAIQHQVLDMVGNGQPNFVDFIMGSLQEDDEDEDEEQENSMCAADETGSQLSLGPSDDLPQKKKESKQRPPENGAGSMHDIACPSKEPDSNENRSSDTDNDENPKATVSSTALLFHNVVECEETRSKKNDHSYHRRRDRRRRASEAPQDKSESSQSNVDDKEQGGRKRRSPLVSGPKQPLQQRQKIEPSKECEEDNTDSDFNAVSEGEGEGSLDVNADVTISTKRKEKLGNMATDSPSSPELMYGDTRLEASDDDNNREGGIDVAQNSPRALNARSGGPSKAQTRSYDKKYESDDETDDEGF